MAKRLQASDTVLNKIIVSDGQWNKENFFCITCNGFGRRISTVAHDSSCTHAEVYSISPTAEIPRKKSSTHTWNLFKKNYVFIQYNIEWIGYHKSWWYKNN